MPDSPKTIILPDHEDMLRRLKSVMDEPHAVEQLYPLILKNAGRELVGMGVVMMLQLAIADYTAGLPPIISILVQQRVDDYITALVDDEEVRNDALTMMGTVRAKVAAK